MVVKMMRWPWPPLVSKKFDVTLVVKRLEGLDLAAGEKLTVEIRWKGPKFALGSFRRRVKRSFTQEAAAAAVFGDGSLSSSDEETGTGNEGGVTAEWNEEFQNICALSPYKENAFHPWEIAFSVFNDMNQVPKKKVSPMGTALLNLAEFASRAGEDQFELSLPLVPGTDCHASLLISLSLLELRITPETMIPVTLSSPRSAEPVANGKEEVSAIKAGLRKVKIFKDYVSIQRVKKKPYREEEGGSEGRSSSRSEDGEYNYYPFDSDSLDDFEQGESDEVPSVRKSFSYGSLAYANGLGGSSYYNVGRNDLDEDWVYYSNRKSDVGSSSQISDIDPSVSEPPPPPPPQLQSSRRIMLPWRKRKMSFRSPKGKGEPLLKKTYGEEGGDDIDFDRRQLSSDEARRKAEGDSSANRSSMSDFGDDSFTVGSWEQKEVVSRDRNMKLLAEVFFASIDQRSERAAGESACTALVAVIADWFQCNRDAMPVKSQFDSLIRDGSLEWRNLCENETYMERFPDKHFDLETVLQAAKIRPLSVVAGNSFVGFFHPEGMDEAGFDFLHGAMSFDNIWDEISSNGKEEEPHLYIVSWNDHFFVLKIEADAYYIIDTLGERLFEGCNQAYILKFDKGTVIRKMPDNDVTILEDATKSEEEEGEVVCRGKDSCKEYIKSFLAAIPIRELQADIKKGLMASTPVHQRLQIEFHYTTTIEPTLESDQ